MAGMGNLDDGSSHYAIYNNVFLKGGLKLREGYARIATNNVFVTTVCTRMYGMQTAGDVFGAEHR